MYQNGQDMTSAAFWAIFSQTRLVTPFANTENKHDANPLEIHL
jgi:hypothetical protein